MEKGPVAPLKIVEHYNEFKKAVSVNDFVRAEENLFDMRKYQGGEKLANELAKELKSIEKKVQDGNVDEQESYVKDCYDDMRKNLSSEEDLAKKY